MKKRKIEIKKIEASIKRNKFCQHIFSIWRLFTDKVLLRLTYRYVCWRHPEFKKIGHPYEIYNEYVKSMENKAIFEQNTNNNNWGS